MLGLGMPELIVIFLIIFLLFGAKSLPDIAKGLGQSVKLFKKGMQETGAEVDAIVKPEQKET